VNKDNILRTIAGLALVTALSIFAWWITRQVYSLKLPFGIPGKALEFPIWAVLVGLAGNLILTLTGQKSVVQPGIRTELFLKVGLVLLGSGINLALLVTAAVGSIIQALIMITSVFFFTWWLAGIFGLEDKLRAVMASALSICGVSAAIAAAGAVTAKKEQVTYVTTLVILVALPLMVISPLIASALHLPDAVAGAWFGGNIDTTAAVVGAGTIYSEGAQQVASIVKATQNVLIGVVAFLLALAFAMKEPGGQRPSPKLIWERFPKFVLGFVLASILYTLGWIDGGKGTVLEALKNWAFTFAFVCMGLDFSVRELKQTGWKPAVVFLVATLFNTILALIVAWLIFQVFLPLPVK
jgi:uncharacterized membrane protein YadS